MTASERSLVRAGLDMLLESHVNYDVISAEDQCARGPWVVVRMADCRHRGPAHDVDDDYVATFSIWRATGAVYREGVMPGTVEDDPFLVPPGSPYDGPVGE